MRKFFLFASLVIGCVMFTSCGDDGGDGGDDLTGYYVNTESLADVLQFSRINTAISNNELLKSYSSAKYYATRSLFFFDNGMWYSSNAHHGACRYMPKNSKGQSTYLINVVQIVNKNTLAFYVANLWDPDKVPYDADILGSVYAGSNIGDLVYASTSKSIYSFAMVDGKLIVSNGDIYSVVNGGLIKDGTSGIMRKYNPNN